MHLFILVAFTLFSPILSQNINEELIEYYEKLINSTIAKAKSYKTPEDAKEYECHQCNKLQDAGSFDFIVIGSGSTGAVVANRLSEISEWNVLLLEAGDFGDNFTAIPQLSYIYTPYSAYNWGFETVPQKFACLGLKNNVCPYPRGKAVGGTTILNGLVYSRGTPVDYDLWAKQGNEGWSFKDVLPFFKKSENYHHNNLEAPVYWPYHGEGGEMSVEYNLPPFFHVEKYFEANRQLGYELTDNNGPWVIGDTPSQLNTKRGRRQDAGTAFIKIISHRKNLVLKTNSYVTKIVIDDNGVATGVEYSNSKGKYIARASKEVILSAGSINSPQILMLSGVGPKKHLEKFGIEVKKDLEVGTTFRDHAMVYGLTFSSNYSRKHETLRDKVKDYLKGVGGVSVPGGNNAIGFYRSKYSKIENYPDLEFMMLPASSSVFAYTPWREDIRNAVYKDNDEDSTFQISNILLHDYSVGTLRLKSADPYDYPVIDPNFLSDKENHDINVLYEGIKLAFKMIKTPAFKSINATFQAKPIPQCEKHKFMSRKYWYCFLRYMTFNVYHPISSCIMGKDPKEGAVVDNKLKVHGLKNLRVADASVIPFTLSGHPNAVCMMIGEKLGHIIKEKYNKHQM